jgi:hypothetical membrane protein
VITRAALLAGAAVPLLYFGTQLLAAALYPGYDFVGQVASELGSPGSRAPRVFNTGAILTGLATLAGAYGYARALPAVARTPRVIVGLVVVALAAAGLAGIQAGVFALPDPRHNPRWLGAGLFVMPLLLLLAVARMPRAGALRASLVLCLVLLVVQFPLRAGLLGLEERTSMGLFQRLMALAVYVPIGVVAFFLFRRMGSAPPERVDNVNVG